MLEVVYTKQFRKEYRKMFKRGFDMSKLDNVVNMLKNEETLEPKHHDHNLDGSWKGYRECHIAPDWLLVYKIDKGILVLTLHRTGSHSDLF